MQGDCEIVYMHPHSSLFPAGSPYRDLISNAILKLQEDQMLQMLYNKWWKEKGAKQCELDDSGKKNANALAIANVGGVFVVLLAGLLLSLIVSVLEFIWKARKNADADRVIIMKDRFCSIDAIMWCREDTRFRSFMYVPWSLDYFEKSMVKSMVFNKDFLAWLQIGWQPIVKILVN